jgi:hypothetical protein
MADTAHGTPSQNLALPRGARARGAGMRRVRELLRGARALVAEVE